MTSWRVQKKGQGISFPLQTDEAPNPRKPDRKRQNQFLSERAYLEIFQTIQWGIIWANWLKIGDTLPSLPAERPLPSRRPCYMQTWRKEGQGEKIGRKGQNEVGEKPKRAAQNPSHF